LAEIHTKSTYTLDPPVDSPIKMKLTEQKNEGKIRFDVAAGNLVLREETDFMATQTVIQNIQARQETRSTVIVTRLPDE
jgi:hypothetical protein